MLAPASGSATSGAGRPRSAHLCMSRSYTQPCDGACCKGKGRNGRRVLTNEAPPIPETAQVEVPEEAQAEDDVPKPVGAEDEQPTSQVQLEQTTTLHNEENEESEESAPITLLFALFCFQGMNLSGFIGLQLSPFLALVDTGAQHAVVGPWAWKNIKQLLSFFGLRPRKVLTAQIQKA